MFVKFALALLATSHAVHGLAANPNKCTTSTMTSTATTTSTVTATPGPIFEVIGYPEKLCGFPQVSKNLNTPTVEIAELIYNPGTKNSNCVPLSGSSLSFSFFSVASPPLAAVPSGCQVIFYSSDACYNDQKNQPVMATSQNVCRNMKARSVRLFC